MKHPTKTMLKTGRGIKVAMIGVPNSGKSSLTNLLIKAKVCAVSKRVDTTTANMTTFLTENITNAPTLPKCQLVVVDSPGIVGLKHAKEVIGTHSDANILADPEKAVKHADHILVVHDVTMGGEYLQHRILHILHRYAHIPASLVLNKIDLIDRHIDLLKLAEVLTMGTIDGSPILKTGVSFGRMGNALIPKDNKDALSSEGVRIHPTGTQEMDQDWHNAYSKLLQKPTHKCSWSETKKLFAQQVGWPHFKSVFFVSCRRGTGADELREYLKGLSNETTWKYSEEMNSSKNMEKNMVEHVRSEFLDNLPPYLAYYLTFDIVEFERLEGIDKPTIRFMLDVKCDKKSWTKTVLRIVSKCQLRLFVKHNGKLVTSEGKQGPDQKNSAEKKMVRVSSLLTIREWSGCDGPAVPVTPLLV
uniref:G domain-containing protein n=1 Tax=Ditylenchus dipsaci TaxID=166011 RepID=A0A915CY15_9BILA